jgi:trk system potassium uptake protein
MNIVILGSEPLGIHVARLLSKEEHNVTLIDNDYQKLTKIAREEDFAVSALDLSHWQVLQEMMEMKPDYFLALSSQDEINLAACMIAKHVGFPQTICKVTHGGYLASHALDYKSIFCVDHFIGTEILAAYQIFKSILSPSHLRIEEFAHGSILLKSVSIPEGWKKKGVPLKEMQLPQEMVIGLIQRKEGDDDKVIFPHGDDELKVGDFVTVIGNTEEMQKIEDTFSTKEQKIERVVIVGGTNVGIQLAYLLIRYGIHVTFIEKDEKICEHLAHQFPKGLILNHDAKDVEFLKSENIPKADAMICCMHHDEENLLVAAMGKEAECKKVIALITDATLMPVLRRVGIEHSFSEKVFTTDRILSILHADNILSICSLADDRAKVVELKVGEHSKVVGVPIKELGPYLPKQMIIAMIESKGQVTIGKGSCVLSPNDTVIIICNPDHLHEIKQLF